MNFHGIFFPFCETFRFLIFTWVMVVFFFGMRFLLPAYYGYDSLLGNGIISCLAEGIASEQPPYGQNESYEKSALLECLDGIGGAGGCKPAAGRK